MRKLLIAICVVFCLSSVLVLAQEYLVGSGDTLYIIVWGDEGLSGSVLIAPDGSIALPEPVGVVDVRGKTVKQVEEDLISKLAKYVKTPRVTVSLRERETGFLVHITGEVVAPSFYKVPEKTTLQELVTRAGGLTKYADTKHIKVNSQLVDFSKFLRENDQTVNPILKIDDVIFVPRIGAGEYLNRIVNVLGCVQRPGTLELEEPMALLDIVTLAGGFTIDADLEKVQVVNLQSGNMLQTASVKSYLSGNSPSDNPIVGPRTAIFVPSTRIPEEITIPVNITGRVSRSGAYRAVVYKSRLADMIFAAGGFSDGADIEKIKIIRQNSKEKGEFNLKLFLLNGDMEQNPLLSEGDTIVVPVSGKVKQITSAIDVALVPNKTVKIIGAVRTPGTFQVSENADLSDILVLGGGATPTADLERVTITREGQKFEVDLRKVLTEGRFDLIPGIVSEDIIFVREQKESKWGKIVRFAGQLSTITVFGVYFITLMNK